MGRAEGRRNQGGKKRHGSTAFEVPWGHSATPEPCSQWRTLCSQTKTERDSCSPPLYSIDQEAIHGSQNPIAVYQIGVDAVDCSVTLAQLSTYQAVMQYTFVLLYLKTNILLFLYHPFIYLPSSSLAIQNNIAHF